MRSKLFFVVIFFLIAKDVCAQDTIKMMHYNLMYYTENSGVSDCNSTNNSLDDKDANLRTIFHHVQPDVFCVNEIGSNVTYADRILNNVINVHGVQGYLRGPLTNYSGGYISNMIFYNSQKLSLYKNYYVTTSYRDINGYTLYYKSSDLAQGDTTFITFWIAHLKAGSSTANAASRHVQTQRLMSKISSMGAPGNYVLSGDFNVYSANEACYQELTRYNNSLYCFYDPIQREGNWNNNGQYSDIHTQSTHTSSEGCFATGGLDDRFDMILVSPYVYYGSEKVEVIPETYHALGQDGHRFNGSIVSPQNNSVPANVATALYNQSDHLPVIVDFAIQASPSTIRDISKTSFQAKVVNPLQQHIEIFLHGTQSDTYVFEIYSMDGKRIFHFKERVEDGPQSVRKSCPLAKGLYLLKISNTQGNQQIFKLVK